MYPLQITTTPSGQTYIGYNRLLTLSEWETYLYNHWNNIPQVLLAETRARKMGGRKYTGRIFGAGFIFPNLTADELCEKIRANFPQLLTCR